MLKIASTIAGYLACSIDSCCRFSWELKATSLFSDHKTTDFHWRQTFQLEFFIGSYLDVSSWSRVEFAPCDDVCPWRPFLCWITELNMVSNENKKSQVVNKLVDRKTITLRFCIVRLILSQKLRSGFEFQFQTKSWNTVLLSSEKINEKIRLCYESCAVMCFPGSGWFWDQKLRSILPYSIWYTIIADMQ